MAAGVLIHTALEQKHPSRDQFRRSSMTAPDTLLNLLIVCPSERTSSRRKWSLIVEKTIRGGAILSYRMTDRFPQSRGQKVTHFANPHVYWIRVHDQSLTRRWSSG